jgi:diaminopimelate decarboxylase
MDGVPYTQMISSQSSPTVCISLDRVKSNLDLLADGLKGIRHGIHYAIKASYFKLLVMAIRKHGTGIEVISEYEWRLARLAGFSAKDIVMNGLGRTAEELMDAIKVGAIVNIDSLSELKKLLPFKEFFQKNTRNIGLRVHPFFNGDGNFVKRDGKLGMDYSESRECIAYAKSLGLNVSGFSFHIFSNQTNPDAYVEPIKSLIGFIRSVEKDFCVKCDYIDIGGGIAPRIFFDNDSDIVNFLSRITSFFCEHYSPDVRIIIEPGRYVVADAVVIFSRIKTIKRNSGGTWAVLDIGTNYLIPAPGSDFRILPCNQDAEKSGKFEKVKFVDGICSPAGFIGESLMHVKEGQIVAVINCGAYTSVMREEFVFGSPRHIYLENGKIIEIINETSFEKFVEYHGWK